MIARYCDLAMQLAADPETRFSIFLSNDFTFVSVFFPVTRACRRTYREIGSRRLRDIDQALKRPIIRFSRFPPISW